MPLLSYLEREGQAEKRGIKARFHPAVDRGMPEGAVLATVEALAVATLDLDRVDSIRVVEAIHRPDEGAFPLWALPPVGPLVAYRPGGLERALSTGAHGGLGQRRLSGRCRRGCHASTCRRGPGCLLDLLLHALEVFVSPGRSVRGSLNPIAAIRLDSLHAPEGRLGVANAAHLPDVGLLGGLLGRGAAGDADQDEAGESDHDEELARPNRSSRDHGRSPCYSVVD